MERSTIAGTLDYCFKAMSPDDRISEDIVQALINEQRELIGVN